MSPRVLALIILAAVAVAVAVALIVRNREGARPQRPVAADVRFDVLDAGCGYQNVVTAQETIPPDNGEFCLVRVTVTNRGEDTAELNAACQFLLSTTGERYTPRTDVLAVDQASSLAFQTPIGPGQVVEDAGLYYDVPAKTKPGAAEFHAACEGQPTRVDL